MTTLTNHDSTQDNRIIVVRQPVGWEVREEQGTTLVRSAKVTDWHRVERTMQAFKLRPSRPSEQ